VEKNLRLSALLIALGFALVLSGCGGGGGTGSGQPSTSSFAQVGIDVRSTAPSNIIPDGKKVYMLANLSGFDISAVPVKQLSQDTGDPDHSAYYEIMSGPWPTITVGSGFSGSPNAIGDPAKPDSLSIIDALYAGYDPNNTQYLARPISQLLDLPRSASGNQAAESSFTFRAMGISQSRLDTLTQHFETNGRKALPFKVYNQPATASAPSMRGGIPTARAGSTVGVRLLWGDIANLYAYGTVSINRTTASSTLQSCIFAHPFDLKGDEGAYPWPVSIFYVDGIVPSTFGTFKLAHPVGDISGALTQDRSKGCVVTWSTEMVKTVPVKTVIKQGSVTKTYNHTCADRGGMNDDDEMFALTSMNGTCVENFLDENSRGLAGLTITIITDNETINTPEILVDGSISGLANGVDMEVWNQVNMARESLTSNHIKSITYKITIN
jgi:hypothetical protein